MSARPGWSAAVCAAPVPGSNGEQIQGFHRQDDNRWLVETRYGLFQLDAGGAHVRPFEGPSIDHVSHIVPINRDLSFIFSHREGSLSRGVFRVDKASLKIQELSGSEALRFTAVGRLPAGGAIVGTDRGLYRADASGLQFQEVPGAETGRVSILEQIDDSVWLVGAAFGAFRTDGRASRAERLQGADTGEVTQIHRLSDGGWLIGSEKGLFRADPSGRSLTALPMRKQSRVAEIQKLADGGWLVRADQGLFLADAQGRRMEAIEDETTSAWRIHHSDERGVLLQNKRLLYALPPGAKKLEFLAGEPISDVHSVRGVQDGWLVATRRGLFRVDIPRRRFAPLKGPAPGRVVSLHPLKNGVWLAAGDAGVFRTDAALQNVEPMPGPAPGQVFVSRPLSDGALLIGGARGLFRTDAEGQGITSVPGAKQTDVSSIERLASGHWLALGRGGLTAVDPDGQTHAAIPGGASGRGVVVQPLPDGRTLLGTPQGMLATATTLADATTSLSVDRPLGSGWTQSGSTVKGHLRHPCSAVAGQMDLSVEATDENAAEAAVRIPARVTGHDADGANLSAGLGSLAPGRWTLRLVSGATGRDVTVGKPTQVLVEPVVGKWIETNWPWLLAAVGIVQTLAFGGLLGLARWRPWSLRVLRSAWAKPLIWFSLLLPYSWPLQRWALSSWFGTMRARTSDAVPFVDMSVRARDGAEIKETELLVRLGTARRLWLQGRSGMGKSMAMAAWRRAFFGEFSSLSKAAKRFGFVFVPVPGHLAVSRGREHNPESTLLHIAEASLGQCDGACDRPLLRAMLRRGRLALAFDSPHSAVREAITAFARTYPNARLIVTSEHVAPDAFESWQLPARMSQEVAELLLQLWLGAYSGSRLTAQLEREDVLPHLLTCYDVRLVSDLVTDDPRQVLPTDRISLYRALFARAAARDGSLRELGSLKSLAWTMTLQGRSDVKSEELASLDRGCREILLGEHTRVLRQAGDAYVFDHDQIRFLLAAECLVEGNRPMASLIKVLESSPVWDCDRADQEELWRFVAALLTPEEVAALWRFSLEDPARVFLQCALHKHGLEIKIFPIGLAAAMSGRDDSAQPPRLRTVEA